MSIFKACDIRGRFGSELQVEHASRLGQALAQVVGRGRFLVGGDGRVSTPQLKAALVESLAAAGCDVTDMGIVSTPMFYFARTHLQIETGVMVTASHNPAGDNGFKITPGALPITEEQMEEIAQAMQQAQDSAAPGQPGSHPPYPPSEEGGGTRGLEVNCGTECRNSPPKPPSPRHLGGGGVERADLLGAYLEYASANLPDLRGMKVAIDCANGMNSLAARALWERTGAQVTLFLDKVDGRFPVHAPNPAEHKNLAFLQERMAGLGADLGVAYDGDGDRAAFLDERALPLSGDQAIVLFAQHALRGGAQTVIFDQKCSRLVLEMIRRGGGNPVMERSGHTYIKRAYLELDAAYAGELSGHHFLKPYGDDALIASLVFAGLLKASGRPLSALLAELPVYATTPDLRVPMAAAQVREVLSQLERGFEGEAKLSRLDGLRIEFADGWGLARPSVTEPVITMRFEGDNPAALERILSRVEERAPALRGKLRKG